MSDLYRVSIPTEIQEASLASLAILCHRAEDTADDVLLLQVMGEVERRDAMVPPVGMTQFRPKVATEVFMEHYRAAMGVRSKTRHRSEGAMGTNALDGKMTEIGGRSGRTTQGKESGRVSKTATKYKIDAPILCAAPWAGGKRRLAPRIVDLLGDHDTYVEPFVGGCAILPQKAPCEREIVNDANPAVVNVLRTIRDYAKELAALLDCYEFNKTIFQAACDTIARPGVFSYDYRRAACQLVVWWMGANGYAGTTKAGWFAQRHTKTGGDPAVRWESFKRSLPALSARLRNVEIHSRDFRDFITEEKDRPGLAIYADPPYLSKRITYAHDFTPQDHADLAAILNQFRRARVVVSYYDAPELATLYPADRWERIEVGVSKSSANSRRGATKTEAVELLLVNRGTA